MGGAERSRIACGIAADSLKIQSWLAGLPLKLEILLPLNSSAPSLKFFCPPLKFFCPLFDQDLTSHPYFQIFELGFLTRSVLRLNSEASLR
jgi:hypothetical protein